MLKPVFRETPRPGRTTLAASFRYAWEGVAYVMRSQPNARIHLVLGLLALLVSIGVGVPPPELAVLVVCIMTVFAAEMMNTVIEALVDLVTSEYHPLAKVAKDVAAGAVLVTAAGSVAVGGLIIGPHLWHFLIG